MPKMDKDFADQLELAKKIVESWPAWKQTSLIVTAMAKRPETSSERRPANLPLKAKD